MFMEIAFLVKDSTKMVIVCANSDFSRQCAHFVILALIQANDTVGAMCISRC